MHAVALIFNVYYLVVIINKKCVQYLRQNKATVFEALQDTSLSDSEDAVVSSGSRYYSMSETMELICQPFDRNT